MIIAETLTFTVEQYTVHQRPRQDNPAWPVYIVCIGERLIGRSFSIPNIDCCRWLELHPTAYSDPLPSPRRLSAGGHRTVRNGHRRA